MSTVDIIQIIFQSVAIVFMLTFIFIGIWSFIIFIKMYKTQRINTFLLEKTHQSILNLQPSTNKETLKEVQTSFENIFEDDNIINFEDNTK